MVLKYVFGETALQRSEVKGVVFVMFDDVPDRSLTEATAAVIKDEVSVGSLQDLSQKEAALIAFDGVVAHFALAGWATGSFR